ncbi:MAG: phosphotyrosine protein phosphatase [Bacteroidales bacterium 36-12]|nr:MAG: phosphotyrosine protein phosphatase [Bacteroidales bacterium 36-12]
MKKKSILFVCLGNICRSPMAEGILKHMLFERNLHKQFYVDSAGLLSYHQGALPDSRMRFHASQRGFHLTHISRPVKSEDLDNFDMIIGMDNQNIQGLKSLADTKEQEAKIFRMTDFCINMKAKEVLDPYYGGPEDFEYVIDLLEDACEGLLKVLVGS